MDPLAPLATPMWCISEASKCKKRNFNGGHDDVLHNCNIGCKKHAADLAFIASRFSQAFLQRSITGK